MPRQNRIETFRIKVAIVDRVPAAGKGLACFFMQRCSVARFHRVREEQQDPHCVTPSAAWSLSTAVAVGDPNEADVGLS